MKMIKDYHFVFCLIFSVCIATPAWSQTSASRPNVVLIMADDLGWRDLGCMGSKYYETPAIDQLASEGLLFTDAYAAAPVCSPTRAALMTGKTPARLNHTAVFDRDGGKMPLLPPDWSGELPLEETTIAERLKNLGYTTAIMGKWHLGKTEDLWPESQGFDVNVAGWESGRPKSYFPPYENPRLPDGPEGEYLTDRIAAEAERFILGQQNTEAPFFLYLPFYNPHLPLQAPEATITRFKGKKSDGGQKIPGYAAMIAHLDMAVGKVLKALEQAGKTGNTLVIFTSDNGGVLTLWEQEVTDNSPLRAEKFLLYEGGIRVPLIVKWPGVTPAGEKTRQMAASFDYMPTIMAAAGAPVNEPDIDGIDLTAVFGGGDSKLIERDLAWHYPHYMPRQKMKPSSAIRSGNYKLVHWHESHAIELYDLASDPGETRDLAPERPGKALELYQKLEAWREKVNARMPRPNPRYTAEQGR